MRPLGHFPEPRPAHGGLVAEGALNLLGRPDLDPLIVLVREAVQNSWDARAGRGQVQVEIASRILSTTEQQIAKNALFGQLPPKGLFPEPPDDVAELQDVLEADTVRILTLTDRGTSGLGGPLRADRPPRPSEPTDFVDLVFNIGQPPDKLMGGGTYGFGKTISFLVSSCRTVIVHTSTQHRGACQQRLIAQAIGNQYTHAGRNFTGRHWWGVVGDPGIEPLTGSEAAQVAARIGLPAFAPEECGTTIAILAPDFGGRQSHEAMRFIADAITWNFWPKMVGPLGQPPSVTFSVRDGFEEIPVTDPKQMAPLKGYADVLQAIRECEAGRRRPEDFPTMHLHEVRSRRPKAVLGWLGMQAVPRLGVNGSDGSIEKDAVPATAAAFNDASHHIALMRRAELVVQYRPGPRLTNPAIEWCGVFRSSEATDRAFAAAEPPTHDDWRSALVGDRNGKIFVNVALREIRALSEQAFTNRPATQRPQVTQSAAVVAEALGGLIASTPGSGATLPPVPARDRVGKRTRRAQVAIVRQWLEYAGHDRFMCVEFTVTAAAGTERTHIQAIAAASAPDGRGTEVEPPTLAAVPQVESISMNGTACPGDSLDVPAAYSGPLILRVRQPEGVGAVVDIDAQVGLSTDG